LTRVEEDGKKERWEMKGEEKRVESRMWEKQTEGGRFCQQCVCVSILSTFPEKPNGSPGDQGKFLHSGISGVVNMSVHPGL
jgi:hypothetical protein